MDLAGIISISGRPGLYTVIAQGKNSIIVESVIDKKRFPAYSTDRISALEDISIYTYEEDKPLKDIFSEIYKKQDGKEAPSHKEDLVALQQFLSDILPNYDEERVYPSDIKKLFQWYNILHKSGGLKPIVEKKPAKKVAAKSEEKNDDSTAKKPAAKKATAKKTAVKKNQVKGPSAKVTKPKPANTNTANRKSSTTNK